MSAQNDRTGKGAGGVAVDVAGDAARDTGGGSGFGGRAAGPPAGPVLVTGAAGYLGQALVAALRGAGPTVIATDLASPPPPSLAPSPSLSPAAPMPFSAGDPAHPAVDDAPTGRPMVGDDRSTSPGSVIFAAGDLTDPRWQDALFEHRPATVFHLAGIVSGAAEADFERGRRVNLDATLQLLERCRRQAAAGGPPVTLVYTSSIAVFGVPLPARIDDHTPPAPTLSYGAHKRAIEILLDDYSRRGLLDARGLRLPGVVVRPPLPNGALSGFNSDLIREPLAGRDYDCPVGEEATLWLSSLRHVVGNLIRMAALPAAAPGPARTVNAPAIAVSAGQIRDAIARVSPAAAARIRFSAVPDPALVAQFGRWPLACDFARARALGLTTDASLDTLIAEHLAGRPAAAGPPRMAGQR
ncbi:MAG TPA: NAD-dependent epimerase/dehydratase family protein [Burkholderiaceae bacterium]|nr:NAD-dependent epimerase/dehydratase family protein [Burkholderiaceae bacterium]